MTTNGFLLSKDLFEELLSYNQNFFQITLDGWQDAHDAVRKQAGGRGSFAKIWENLLNLKKVEGEFEIQLRIHVRHGNADSLRTLMSNISENFGSDQRFSLDFQHLRDLGGEGGKTIEQPVTFEELRSLEEELRGILIGSSPGLSDQRAGDARAAAEATYSRQSDRAGPSTSVAGALPSSDICYAAKPNSLLIRSDGRIGKCTVALTDDRNTIGKINSDGTVTIDNGKLRPWIRGLSTLNRDELECPLGGMFLQNELDARV